MDRALYDVHSDLHERHWWFRARKKIVNSLLGNAWYGREFNIGLDIGSGGGAMLELLKKFASRLELLEPDKKLGRELATKYSDRVRVIVSTLENFLPDNQFELHIRLKQKQILKVL